LGNAVTSAESLISGDTLKAAALTFLGEMRTKVEREQGGLYSVFDSWIMRVLARLVQFDPGLAWEDSVRQNALQTPAQDASLPWDLMRLKLFLDRRQQGRFVDYAQRERSGRHYHPRFGTEFGPDVILTCQGAPSLMRWRGVPLMKNVFDFAIYPALIAELRPRTIFEIGSGLGASAVWFADNLSLCGIDGEVHSVDRTRVTIEHRHVTFYQGDCSAPDSLFEPALLRSAPHPWLVVEDAHHNVGEVLEYFHGFLLPGDYLVVEDSDVKRPVLRKFATAHVRDYLVDTRFTDNFGRNATCAADAIFVRTPANAEPAAIEN
jgi:cephalosporin hydroxylase